VSRILISRLRFMGDVILTTPLIRAVRRACPQAYIAYLAEEPYAELLQHNPHLDEVIGVARRAPEGLATLRHQWALVKSLRAKRFDLAIDLFATPRSALLMWASGARERVGGDFRIRRHLYTLRVPHDGQGNAIEFHLESLKPLGIVPDGKHTEVILTEAEAYWAKDYLLSKGLRFGRPLIGLHPGATWPNKRWLLERFTEVAHRAAREFDAQVLVTQGPGERDGAEAVVAGAPAGVVAADLLSPRQLAAVLKECHLFVGNDAGPMHLAVAVGTPTLGLFGPGQPHIWFPYDPTGGHRAIFEDIECRPCHKNDCPLGTLDCMKRITSQRVLEAIEERLRGR